MSGENYKKLSLREFDQAAEKFDDSDPSVCNMCRKDYPEKNYTGIDLSEKMIKTAKKQRLADVFRKQYAVFEKGDIGR